MDCPTVNYGLSDCGLSDCGLWTVDYGLSDCELSDCGLCISQILLTLKQRDYYDSQCKNGKIQPNLSPFLSDNYPVIYAFD